MRKCPHCSKKVSETAKKCKFCGERIVDKNDNQNFTLFTFSGSQINEEPASRTEKILVGSIAGFVILLVIGIIIALIIIGE